MSSYSYTDSDSFTVVHARKLTAKVTTDLHQCRLFYGEPSATMVDQYRQELELLLAKRGVSAYEFGFRKSGRRILSWHYTVSSDGSLQGDDGAGTIDPTLDRTGAEFFTFMWWSSSLSDAARDQLYNELPFQRGRGDAPTDGSGYWTVEKHYFAGGVTIERTVFRPL